MPSHLYIAANTGTARTWKGGAHILRNCLIITPPATSPPTRLKQILYSRLGAEASYGTSNLQDNGARRAAIVMS
jgi:hypothetical protein